MKTVTTLPMAQWLGGTREAQTIVAYRGHESDTLATMRMHVQRLHHQLAQLPQQRWALYFEDSYRFVVALLAVLHSGKTPVIPGEGKPALLREQRHLFDGFITDTDIALDSPTLSVDEMAVGATDETITLPALAANAHVVLFTSGSTGQPREVIKTIASLDCEAQWLGQLWGKTLATSHFAASVTHQHLYGLTFRVFLPMAMARPFARDCIQFPEQLAASTPAHTYAFISSPAFLKRLDQTLPSPNCDFVLSAGGPLHWADAQATTTWLGVTPHEIYGSTEAGVVAWRARREDAMPWQPFDGVRFTKAVAPDTAATDDPVWRIQSALIEDADGLLLDDRLDFTAADGRFHLRGRRDRIVKIEEKRISLTNIETRLGMLPGIREAAAVSVLRADRVHVGVVVVLDEDGKKILSEQGVTQLTQGWRDALRQLLESVAIPRYWRFVEAIPVNKQSKRVYPELQELFDVAS
jgi:acyl-coenzyme A synthetase/AMP-(fatty) acid ligase